MSVKKDTVKMTRRGRMSHGTAIESELYSLSWGGPTGVL
jgi:hypothetical protein